MQRDVGGLRVERREYGRTAVSASALYIRLILAQEISSRIHTRLELSNANAGLEGLPETRASGSSSLVQRFESDEVVRALAEDDVVCF